MNLQKNRTGRALGVILLVTVLGSQGAAIDLNSTTSLRYFPDNNLEFQVRPDGTIDTKGDIQLDGNNIDTSGNTITLRDSTNNQDILNAQEGGNVEIPNGNLNMSSSSGSGGDIKWVKQIEGAPDQTQHSLLTGVGDGTGVWGVRDSSQTGDAFIFKAEEGGPVKVMNGANFNATGDLFVDSSTGNVNIPNGNLDLSGGNNDVIIGDAQRFKSSAGGAVYMSSGSNNNVLLEDKDGDSALEVQSDESVNIPNGNLDVSGNNITNIDTLKFEEGTSIDGNVSINGTVNTTGDIDLNDNNLLDANRVETNQITDPEDGRIETDSSLDFNSNGNINSVNSINVGSFTSNNGASDIQFNQGFTVDGSAGGDGGVTLSGSGGLDVDAAGGDNQQNSGDSLRLGGHINFDGGSTNNPVIRTPGGGSGSIRIYDDANTQILAEFNEGGSVEIPNGDLKLGSTTVSGGGDGEVYAGGGVMGVDGTNPNFRFYESGTQKSRLQWLSSGSGGPYIRWQVDGTNTFKLDKSNNVEIPNGNLDTQGNRIVDTTSGNTVYVGDANSDTVRIDAGGSGDAVVSSGNGGSGSTERLRVTSSSGEADIDVSNSDVDLQGNSVTSSGGEVCIGDQCA